MLSLSKSIIVVVSKISSKLTMPKENMFGLSLSMGSSKIDVAQFDIFAISQVVLVSFLASLIVSQIKNGNMKEGLKNSLVYVVISLIVYLVLSKALVGLFSTFI
jgi:hypothetical protein